jgi:DNA polymerase elongation subunit (family B)
MEPIVGLHRNVCLADYASMYPTIMIDMCISQENVQSVDLPVAKPEGAVTWSDAFSGVTVGNKLAIFQSGEFSVPQACRRLMTERVKVGKRSAHGNALKVLANSIYGALGYENSPLYSPTCAAAVTLCGRWCLTVSSCILEKLGFRVVYGDTDSTFVTAPSDRCETLQQSHTRLLSALDILHTIFSHTPFKSMRLEAPLEDSMPSVLLLRKKNYCFLDSKGGLTSKGMSASRKDRLGVCRVLSPLVLKRILEDAPAKDRMRTVGAMISMALDKVLSQQAPLELVSREVRSQGQRCLVVKTKDGDILSIPCEGAPTYCPVPFSTACVCKTIHDELDRPLRLAGLGGMSSVLNTVQTLDRYLDF